MIAKYICHYFVTRGNWGLGAHEEVIAFVSEVDISLNFIGVATVFVGEFMFHPSKVPLSFPYLFDKCTQVCHCSPDFDYPKYLTLLM